MSISTHNEEFSACLKSEGATIYFDSWLPNTEDLASYPQIEMTSNQPWNPSTIQFPSLSDSEIHDIKSRNISSIEIGVRSINDEGNYDYDATYNPITFCKRVINSVRVNPSRYDIGLKYRKANKVETGKVLKEDEILPPRTIISEETHSTMTPEDLSERWNISVAQATLILKATTRKLLRFATIPIARRYRVYRMFGVRRINCSISTDTLDSRCDSIHGHRYCQVFDSKEYFIKPKKLSISPNM